MNCKQHHQTYEEFKELKARFDEKLKELRETGKIDPKIQELKEQLQQKKEEMRPLLEKHFSKFEFKDEIEGFNNLISTTHPLSESQILVGGNSGELKILEKQPTGEWQFKENEIEGFKNRIKTATPLSETQILIGGYEGKLRILKKNFDLDNI